jgi:hypothetical protein
MVNYLSSVKQVSAQIVAVIVVASSGWLHSFVVPKEYGKACSGTIENELGPRRPNIFLDSVSINPRAIRVKLLDQDEGKRGARDRDKRHANKGVGGKERDA